MRLQRVSAILGAMALILVACDDESGTTIPAGVEIFTAVLTGAAEKPTAVITTATGTATLTVLGNLVSWKVDLVDIDSVTLSHIHKGVADSAGGVIVNFNPAPTGLNFTGNLTTGSATVADSVLTHMRNGRAYVNVHTKVNGGGEVRGQIIKVQ